MLLCTPRLFPRTLNALRTRAVALAREAEPPTAVVEPLEPSFASLGGVTRPTAVQVAALPALLRGRNVAMQAQTGSGKTLAYLLPLLTTCFALEGAAMRGGKRVNDHVLGVVVAPSQELAIQIVRQAEALLGPSCRHLVAQAIGGANMRRQLEALKRHKPVLVVGTPGRLAELSLLGHLKSHHARCLVLDEADELLNGVYAKHCARIVEQCGRALFAPGRQTVLVSATLSTAEMAAFQPWCDDPEVIRVGDPNYGTAVNDGARPLPLRADDDDAEGGAPGGGGHAGGEGGRAAALPSSLSHQFVSVPDARERVDTLRRAIHALGVQRALVFLNFGRRIPGAVAQLAARGMPAAALHGDMGKAERGGTLAAFRAGKLRALLVSDLAARGLDVPQCDAVFNLELPSDGVHYAHRAGRTARGGRPGRVVTLASPKERFVLAKFERSLGVTIEEATVKAGLFETVAEVTHKISSTPAKAAA